MGFPILVRRHLYIESGPSWRVILSVTIQGNTVRGFQLLKIFFGTMYKAFSRHNRSGICPMIHWTYPMMTYDTTCYTLSNDMVRPGQTGRHFADGILKGIFLKEICCILIKISLKYVPWVQIDNKSALFQKMACPLAVDKSLPEPTMISSLMHTVLLGLHGVTTANKNISCALVGS